MRREYLAVETYEWVYTCIKRLIRNSMRNFFAASIVQSSSMATENITDDVTDCSSPRDSYYVGRYTQC